MVLNFPELLRLIRALKRVTLCVRLLRSQLDFSRSWTFQFSNFFVGQSRFFFIEISGKLFSEIIQLYEYTSFVININKIVADFLVPIPFYFPTDTIHDSLYFSITF